jgi:hypothetical protein
VKELLANKAQSTLAAGITSAATSLTVTSAATFPTSGQFRLLVDDEIMLVVGVSGASFTVRRAQENTSAAAHSTSAAVVHILTAGALSAYGQQSDPLFGNASRPPFGLADASGNGLALADFTIVNQGSATLANSSGIITISAPSVAGESVIFGSRAAPATPYTVTACLDASFYVDQTSSFLRIGAGWRDSSAGKLIVGSFEMQTAAQSFLLLKYSSPTAFNSSGVSRIPWLASRRWFKLADDGTSLTFSISGDGIQWLQVWQEARTTFLTPDQVGFAVECDGTGGSALLASLLSWQGA